MADYKEYSIIAEEQCICVQKPILSPEYHRELQNYAKARDTMLYFSTHQTSWEFTIGNSGPYVKGICVQNKHKVATNYGCDQIPLAEIVMWQWNSNNHQHIITKSLFNKNGWNRFVTSSLDYDAHFVIRLLGKRKLADEVCPPLDSSLASDEFTISVGEQNFIVSAHRLMQVSPVFRAMLTDEMHEKTSREVEVKDVEPEQFRAFLEVIDPDQNVYPNPTTVVGVLKLADRYQVNLAKDRCEAHLLNCVEMPLIERLQLADTYDLNKLKDSILSIGSVKLRALYKANFDGLQVEGQFSRKLLGELTLRLCDNE